MKLYLSSYQLGNEPSHLTEILGPRKHAALILNAGDVYGDANRSSYFAKFRDEFLSLGVSCEDIDLRKYFGDGDKLKKDLERFGLIWASGGNAFALRRAMSASGLDKILPNILKDTDT